MGYLVVDGVNDYCTIPNALTGNAGTDAYTLEFNAAFPTAPSVDRFLIGVGSGTSQNGFGVSTSGRIQVFTAGAARYNSSAGYIIFDSTFRTYRLEHDAGGAWRVYRDGSLFGSGTYATSSAFTALGVFFRIHPTSSGYLGGNFSYITTTGLGNSDSWQADLSGGTGSTLPTTSGTNNATLLNFPTDNSQWQGFSSGTPWTGTIGKTSLSAINKTLAISVGQSLFQNKTTLTLSTKQQAISTGFVATNGKTSLTLSPQQEVLNVGYINTLSKLGLALLQKQLSITVGANLPFTGVLGKTTYALNGKQLNVVAGWNSGVVKSTLPVSDKQESVLAGFVNTINEINIPVNGKPLNLQTGTSISYVGTINKGSLNASGKPLNVVVGTSIPFVGLMQKTSLTLTGKQLGVVRGQVLDLQKQALNIVGKQLSLGEIVYPIVPIERIFTVKDGDRIHYFKQTTTVYVMKNN